MSTLVGIIPQFSYNLYLISHIFIKFNAKFNLIICILDHLDFVQSLIFSSCDVGYFVGTPLIFYDFSLVSKSFINTCIHNYKCQNVHRHPLF